MNDELFLKPGHYLGVAFQEGPVFFRITGREIVSYEPYEVGVINADTASDWFVPKDSRDNIILEPEMQRFILHTFVGVAPEAAEVYLNFPPRVARFNLYGTREVGGKVKWIDGVTSPFGDPSERAELISFKDLYPEFSVYNPTSDTIYGMLDFEIAKYSYRVVVKSSLIDKLIEGQKKCKFYTFLEPYQIPDWLYKLVGRDNLEYNKEKWNELMGKGV